MIGARLNAQTSRVGNFCKTCGEEAYEVLTPEERKLVEEWKRQLNQRETQAPSYEIWRRVILIIIAAVFLLYGVVLILNRYTNLFGP